MCPITNLLVFPADVILPPVASGHACVVCTRTLLQPDGTSPRESVPAGTIKGTDATVRACIGSCSAALGIDPEHSCEPPTPR